MIRRLVVQALNKHNHPLGMTREQQLHPTPQMLVLSTRSILQTRDGLRICPESHPTRQAPIGVPHRHQQRQILSRVIVLTRHNLRPNAQRPLIRQTRKTTPPRRIRIHIRRFRRLTRTTIRQHHLTTRRQQINVDWYKRHGRIA
jgi:hypothetical protein